MYYEVTGTVGTRVVTFEWFVSHFQAPTQYYHLAMQFYEATPGTSRFIYYTISDDGVSATVGAQGQNITGTS
jgi:hypothetical protein